MTLETPRLLLRPWRLSDTDTWNTLSKDVGYNCFTIPGIYLVKSDDEARMRIQQHIDAYEKHGVARFLVIDKISGEVLGQCGFNPFSLEGREVLELGYRYKLTAWGKGYATEAAREVLRHAFEVARLESVVAFAVPQNPASLKVIEKLGFVYQRDFVHCELVHRLYALSR